MLHIKKFLEFNTYKPEYDNQFKLLRKLTLKSKLGFGKYLRYTQKDSKTKDIVDEYTIQDILSHDNSNTIIPNILGNEHSYLRWIYFQMENITFIDEILDELGIYEKYRIKKPGKNPDLFNVLEKELEEAFLPENIEKRWQTNYKYDIEKFLNHKPESKYILPYDKK